MPNATRPLPTLVTSHNTPGYIWESNLTSKHKNILSGSLITMLKIVAKTNLFSCLVAIKNYFDKFSFSHIYLHRESIEYFVTKKKVDSCAYFLTIGRNDDAILLKDNMH